MALFDFLKKPVSTLERILNQSAVGSIFSNIKQTANKVSNTFTPPGGWQAGIERVQQTPLKEFFLPTATQAQPFRQYVGDTATGAFNTAKSALKLSPPYQAYRAFTNPITPQEQLGDIAQTGLGALNTWYRTTPAAPVLGATFGGLKAIRQGKAPTEVLQSAEKGITSRPGLGEVFSDNPKVQKAIDIAFMVAMIARPYLAKKLGQLNLRANELEKVATTLGVDPNTPMSDVEAIWKEQSKQYAHVYAGQGTPEELAIVKNLNSAKDVLQRAGVLEKNFARAWSVVKDNAGFIRLGSEPVVEPPKASLGTGEGDMVKVYRTSPTLDPGTQVFTNKAGAEAFATPDQPVREFLVKKAEIAPSVFENKAKAGIFDYQGQAPIAPFQQPSEINFQRINLETPPPKAGGEMAGEQRKFLETVTESQATSQPLKEQVSQIQPQTYTLISHEESMELGTKRLSEGLDKARDFVFGDAPPSSEKAATAVALAKEYENQGNYDLAVDVVENFDRQLREAGRFVDAAKLWDNLSPAGMVRWAEREIGKVNAKRGFLDNLFGAKKVELQPEEKASITAKMSLISKMPPGDQKTQATLRIIDEIAKKVPPGASELVDAYRYQNMLSGFKTHERNFGENLFNTFITRPWDLATKGAIDWVQSVLTGKEREAYVRDFADYYKNAINALPNAAEAFRVSWKHLGATGTKTEMGIDLGGSFQQARAKQIPGALTFVPRLMEGVDRFYATLIAAGEYAVNKRHGLADEEAISQANKIAQDYLYRGKVKASDKQKALFVRGLAGLEEMAEKVRRIPVIGKPFSWFVPFVKVATNKGIAMVERTPLGLIGGKPGKEELAKAMNGIVLAMIGASFALRGETTWAAPSDPKEKELFYASGRKPFSFRVGDKWIPMWYLGPFALAFALPAAYQYYTKENRTALTDGQLRKLTNIATGATRFLASQSMIQGMGNFFAILEGDVDTSLEGQVGFTAGQLIPLQGLIRWINSALDPVYRKSKGFGEELMKNMPVLSTQLEPYTDFYGQPSRREPVNFILPYDIGTSQEAVEPLLESRQRKLQQNAIKNQQKKQKSTFTAPYSFR